MGGSYDADGLRDYCLEPEKGASRRAAVVPLVVVTTWLAIAYLFVQERAPTKPPEMHVGTERPTPSAPTATRLRPPPELGPAISGPHEFLRAHPDDRPVTYDPCRAIRFVTNDRTAPPGAEMLVEGALTEIEHRTGLEFVDDGPTEESPNDRRAFQPSRYGDEWAPVLISWSDPDEVGDLHGDVAGIAGSTPDAGDGEALVYVTGMVVLDGPQFAAMLDGGAPWPAVEALVRHELGHLVGLDHVDDDEQIMFDGILRHTAFGFGDLEGLAAVGAGDCHETI